MYSFMQKQVLVHSMNKVVTANNGEGLPGFGRIGTFTTKDDWY